jgi:hypothetical protein
MTFSIARRGIKTNSNAHWRSYGNISISHWGSLPRYVLVWTASHPHGFMARSASQIDERKV